MAAEGRSEALSLRQATISPEGEPASTSVAVAPAGSAHALRAALVFGIGSALQRGIAFLLLPVYTRAIGPAEYGVLSVFLAVASAAGILFGLGLDVGIFRSFFLLSGEPERQERLLASIWRFLVVFPTVAAVLFAAAAWPFAGKLGSLGDLNILLALLSGAMFVGSATVPLTVMRVQHRLRGFTVLSVVNAVAATGLTFLLVVVVRAGVTGWLTAMAGANAICLVMAMVVVPWRPRVPFDRRGVRNAILFGLTLVPHAFSHWALLLADRGVLATIVSQTSLGVYSLAANLGLPVMIAVQALNQGFMPSYARAGADAEAKEHLREIVVLQIALVVGLALGGMLLGSPLVSIMAAPAYGKAASLVAWIALGYGFLGLYYTPMNGVTLAAGRSSLVWTVSGLSAATNIALLFLFVPQHGILAAAVASAIGYVVLLIGISIYARGPDNPVTYEWSKIVPVVGAAVAVYGMAALTSASTGWQGLGERTGWLLAFFGLLLVFGIVKPSQLRRTHS